MWGWRHPGQGASWPGETGGRGSSVGKGKDERGGEVGPSVDHLEEPQGGGIASVASGIGEPWRALEQGWFLGRRRGSSECKSYTWGMGRRELRATGLCWYVSQNSADCSS